MFQSKSARRNERRREREEAYQKEREETEARISGLQGMSTRALLQEAYGYEEDDVKVVFFNRLLDHLDALGIDTHEV